MTKYTYTMLEYRLSETDTSGEPFLLLFEMTDVQSRLYLKAFVRNDVNQFLAQIPLHRAEWTRAFLAEFIGELAAPESVNFGHISQTSKLSIGPLVTSQKGSFAATLLGQQYENSLEALILAKFGIPMTDVTAHNFELQL
jgi:hypothetical protein